MALNTKFNAKNGISVGVPSVSLIDNVGNATFPTVSAGQYLGLQPSLSGLAALVGGNSLGSALTIGTNDSFNLNLETGGSNRIVIDSAGASVSTTCLLQVGSGGVNNDGELRARVLRISADTGNSTAKIYSTNGFSRDIIHHALEHKFGSYQNEFVRFTSDQRVGIGTTTPIGKLDIADTTSAGSGGLSGSVLNLTQTWSTSGAPTSIKLNVTDTSSSANSLLMDLQIGARSSYSFGKTTLTLPPSANSGLLWPGVSLQNQTCSITRKADDSLDIVARLGGGKYITIGGDGYGLGIFNGFLRLNTGLRDVYLSADDNNIFAQRNGVSAQTFRLYNTYSNATTFERLNLRWDTNTVKIGTEKGSGGGLARDLAFETDASTRMTVSSGGNVGIGTIYPTERLNVVGNVRTEGNLSVYNLNTAITLDRLTVDGSQGRLFTVTDALTGSLLSVNDISGLPILEVFDDDRVIMGEYASNALAVVGRNVGIGTASPSQKLTVVGVISSTNVIYASGGNSNAWNSAYTSVNTISANGASTYTTVNTNSANWTSAYTAVTAVSAIGASTYTTVNANSANWSSVYTTTNTNSANWSNVYSTVNSNSANYILDGGNTKGANLLVGTNDNFNLNFETAGTTKMTVTNAGNIGIGTALPVSPLHIVSGVNSNLYLGTSATNDGIHEIRFGFIPAPTNSYAASIVGIKTGGNGRGNLEFRVAGGVDSTNAIQSDTGLRITSVDVQVLKPLLYAQDVLAIGDNYNSGVKAFKFTRTENKAAIWSVPVGGYGNGDIRFTTGNEASATPKTESDATFIISRNGGVVIGNSYIAQYPTNGNLLVQNSIGIGTTAPIAKLDIADTTFAGSSALSGSALNITQTWATSGNPTAIKLNITNTNSGDASNLLDLQVGGVSKLSVAKSGNLFVNSPTANGGPGGHAIGFDISGTSWGFSNGGANSFRFGTINDAFLYVTTGKQWRVPGTTTIGWAPGTPDGGADLLIARDGAGTLAQRNSTNAQELRVYRSYTDASNYERFFVKTNVGSTSATQIGLSAAGTGQNRNLEIVAGGSTRMIVTSAGNVGIGTVVPDNLLHIDCTLNKGILLTNSTQAPARANFYINAGTGGAYNAFNISESYDSVLYSILQTYQRSIYLGGFANAISTASITVLNDQSKLDLLQLRQGLLGSSTVFKVASSGETTISGNISSSRVVYASGGNSDLWNSAYTSVNNISANGASTYTTVNSNSANWSSSYTVVTAVSAIGASTYTTVNANSANWNSVYTTTGANSANWNSVYSTYNAASANILKGTISSSGQGNITIPRVGGGNESITISELGTGGNPSFNNLTVSGNLSVVGDFTYLNTGVSVTSALSVVNTGTGPALVVRQSGTTPIAHFIDADGTGDIIFANNGFVGLGTATPNERLTVVGAISSNNVIYASGGNSNLWNSTYTSVNANSANGASVFTTVNTNSANWNSVYTTTNTNSANWSSAYTTTNANSANWNSVYSTVNSNSANYILAGGNSKGADIVIGTNDNFALNLETAGSTKISITSGGLVGVGTTSPATRLQVNNKVIDAAGYVYDTDTLLVTHQTPTATATLNDPKTVLVLARQGTSGQAFGAAAAFNLSRFENSSTNSRTRLDISMANGSYDLVGTNVLTLLSNGNVGVGRTAPLAKLDVNGTTFINATGDGGTGAMLTVGGTGTTIYTPGAVHATGGLVLSSDNQVLSVNVAGGNIVKVNGLQIVSGGPVLSYLSGTGIKVLQSNGTTYGSVNAGTLALGSTYAGVAAPTNGVIIEGNVGIGTITPNEKLTVVGAISSNNAIYASGGNSNLWNSAYTAVTAISSNSANYILDGGNTKGANLLVGTNDNFNLNLETAGTTRVTVTSAGNVGIGTTTPQAHFDVNGNARVGGFFTIDRSGGNNTSILQFTARGAADGSNFGNPIGNGAGELIVAGLTGLIVGTQNSTPLVLGTTNAERVRITATGNVGIGTTTPNYKLEVVGNGFFGDSTTAGSALTVSTGAGSVNKNGLSIINSPAASYTALSLQTNWSDGNGGDIVKIFNSTSTKFLINNSGNAGIGTATPNEKLTVVGAISSNNVIYALGGNSNLWNSAYTSVNTISANGASAFTTVNANSANWGGVFTTTNANSANWNSVYSSYNSASATIHNGTVTSTSQGNITIPKLGGVNESITLSELGTGGNPIFNNLTVSGNLSVAGDFTYLNTSVSVTSALSVVNTGTGPALLVRQSGTTPIAHFIDADGTGDIIFDNNGFVGLGTATPNQRLTVVGGISSNNVVYASGGNSNIWNSTFTSVNANSANGASVFTTVNANSANWSSVYTTTNANSANWSNVFTITNTNSAKWDNTYTTVNANSANWSGVYSTVNTNSASYILDGGNTKGANLLVGTNDGFALNFETAGTTKMTVTSAGFVGIGTTAPSSIFEINDSTAVPKDVTLSIRNGNFGWWAMTSSNNGTAGFLRFASNNSGQTPLTLDAATGSVGISKTSPTAKLDIADTTLAGSGGLQGAALSVTQTWATSGNPTLIYGRVTNTSSGASSNLIDIGTVADGTLFKVTKAGNISFGYAAGFSQGFEPSSNTSFNIRCYGTTIGGFASTDQPQGLHLNSSSSVVWTNAAGGIGSFASVDLYLNRRGPANLRLGAADAAAPVAQTLSVQSVVSGTTDTAGTNFTVAGSQGTGTGTGGSIIFKVAPAGSSSTIVNALSTALTINSTGKATFAPATNSTNSFEITNLAGSPIVTVDSTNRRFNAGGGALSVSTTTGATTLYNAAYLGWQDAALADQGTTDVRLYRDAATALAQRDSTNAQTFRVYNTFTDSSNYERGVIGWTSNVLQIGTEQAGSGAARNMTIIGSGRLLLRAGTSQPLRLGAGGTDRWDITSDGHLTAITDNAYDIGANGANRPRNVFIAGSMDVAGSIAAVTVYAGPTANATALTTPTNGILRITNNSATDFNRLQFGGGTSSFPSIKRNGATLQIRLADDSANAALETANLTAIGAISSTNVVYASGGNSDLWNSAYTSVNTISGNGASTFTTVNANSASWSSVYTTTNANSAKWDSTHATTNTLSSTWQSGYTTTNANSAKWDSTYASVNSISANGASTYTTVNANSANWSSVYSTVNTNSANYILDGGNTKGAALLVGTNDSYALSFETAGTTKMTVTSGGNVGIGTTTTPSKLEIVDTTSAINLSGAALQIYHTWNAPGVDVTAIKLNVNSSASGANSKFIDLQGGGISYFSVDKAGATTMASAVFVNGGNSNLWNSDFTTTSTNSARWSSAYTTTNANSANWSSAYTTTNANSAAWSSVYSTVNTNSASYIVNGGNTLGGTITVGTNDANNFNLETNGTIRVSMSSTGQVGIGTTTPDADLVLYKNVIASPTTFKIRTATGTGSRLDFYRTDAYVATRFDVLSTNEFQFFNNNDVVTPKYIINGTNGNFGIGTTSTVHKVTVGGSLSASGTLYGDCAVLGDATASVSLERDAANTLGIRTTTAAQTLNVYGTYTSGTNFERLSLAASALGGVIGHYAGGGGGVARDLLFQTSNTTRMTIAAAGSVNVAGHFSAATKSFLIDHPTQEGKKLQYGVVESNQHSVLVRGKTSESIIELPEEWSGLVHEDSVTVQLTPIGSYQQLYVVSQDNQRVVVGGSTGKYNYTIYGERKDVDKLQTVV